ncbi:MAG: hypothetical protein COA79_01040 [Planctomycetota bacterium]|nr:MAG: hypothetical protein COA79_01040 [Planctomycetota bacterium]
MDINLNNTINVLTTSLNKNEQIYSNVLNIAKQMQASLTAENEIQLLELLEAKNNLMAEAMVINQNADPFRKFWDDHFSEAEENVRNDLKIKVEAISEYIQEILEIDAKLQTDIEIIKKKQNENSKQMNNIRKLQSAYGEESLKNQFIDKSE